MKITGLKIRLIDIPLDAATGVGYAKQRSMGCVLTFLESDQGPIGEGMISTLNGKRLKVFAELVESLAPLIVGTDPTRGGAFLARAWTDLRSNGVQGMAALAVAAIETALWDLRGKLAGLNVAHLLGACHDALPAYHSGGLWVDRTIDQLQKAAAGHVDRGFRAMKMRLTGEAANDLARVRAIREAIGPDVLLLADANQKMNVPQAIRLGRKLEEFELGWLEEPVPSHDRAGSAAVAAALDTPIAAGENASTSRGANELLRERALDVLMVDVQRVGGPTEFIKSAHLAEAAGAPFSSHLFSEMSLALLAAVPNALCLEYMPWHSPVYQHQIELDGQGRAILPDRPGWGFAFDPDAIERFKI
jgi:L-alanine-DL-glutamate epimerase-like enolase superfamily enzyme